jgi:hypothetical protein
MCRFIYIYFFFIYWFTFDLLLGLCSMNSSICLFAFIYLFVCISLKYSRAPISTDSVSTVSVIRGLPRSEKKLENYRNKRFIGFKTCDKREWAVTWWNPAAQTCPVLDLSYLGPPVLVLPHRTCLHSASSVLTVHISCCDITVFVFRKPLFIN